MITSLEGKTTNEKIFILQGQVCALSLVVTAIGVWLAEERQDEIPDFYRYLLENMDLYTLEKMTTALNEITHSQFDILKDMAKLTEDYYFK